MLRSLGAALGTTLRFQVQPNLGSLSLLSRGVKQTTGITGLDVDPEARQHLQERLEEVLQAIKVVPETAAYRQSVEATINRLLEQTQSSASDEELELQLGTPLEQQIKMVEGELGLIPKMAEWKPWEVPEGYTVPIVEEEEVEKMEEKLAGGAAPPK